MKSPFAKSRNSDEALESALRGSPPGTEYPPELHDSIMNAVHTANRVKSIEVSGAGMFERIIEARWILVTGFAGLVLLGVWLSVHHHSAAKNQNPPPLTEISNAFATSQKLMNSLPSVTVGPLSDELAKVNRDLDRTAEFLLATVP